MHRVWEFLKSRVSIDITSSLIFAAASSYRMRSMTIRLLYQQQNNAYHLFLEAQR